MNTVNVCLHFKLGFCKYGVRCRQNHVNIRCEKQECDQRTCNKRHPQECRYYYRYKRLKFGNYCSYDHIDKIDAVLIELQLIKDKQKAIDRHIELESKFTRLANAIIY